MAQRNRQSRRGERKGAEKWIVCSAWPYAHLVPHLGNLIGSLLSADVFARYLRLKGKDVLYVTGSDEHGTPIEVEALREGISPYRLSSRVHKEIVKALQGFSISTDNYTRTHNPIHIKYVQGLFMEIYKRGYIFTKEERHLYCEKDKIFLPDRFVIGICPLCGYKAARGDQCENCGSLLTPSQLVEVKCVICGGPPIPRETTHWYFDLPKFTDRLKEMISKSDTLTENAKRFSLQMIEKGLQPRSVTRDNKWGIPAPFPGASDKTIYVWLEAVLGYVSAVIEYFKKRRRLDRWKDYWLDKDTNAAFFIGKDNIPFHTIILPSLLMASEEGYTQRFHVSATEFLMFEGDKFSKSKRIGIWMDEALQLLPGDYWRFSLILLRPEVRDTNFSWSHLEKAVNEELNNQLGNLVMRVLTLINKYFDGYIPKPKALSEMEVSLMDDIVKTRDEVERWMKDFRFQRALISIMDLVRRCNSVLNILEPWRKASQDRDAAGNTLYVMVHAIKAVAVMLLPFIPNMAYRILKDLRVPKKNITWSEIEALFREDHRVTRTVRPIFNKIDKDSLVERLERMRTGEEAELIDIEDFNKIDIKIGRIVDVAPIEKKDRLLKLTIDLGGESRTVVAGLAKEYKRKELLNKEVAVICNLRAKVLAGIRSEAMLLAAVSEDGKVSLLIPDKEMPPGCKVC